MPYNPGIQDRSGELLAQGIGGATDALMAAVEKKKKENDNAKYTEALFKNNKELQEASGLSYEELRGLSARDKIQTGMAAIAKLHQAMDSQDRASRRRLQESEAGRYLQQQQQESMAPVMAQRMDQMMSGEMNPDELRTWMEDSPAGAPMPARADAMDPMRAYLKAGAETGAIDTNDLKAYARDMSQEKIATTREEARRKADMNPREYVSKSGKNFVLYGNSIVAGDAKPIPAKAPTGEPWIFDQNEKQFTDKLLEIDDPDVRDAVIRTRIQHRHSQGKQMSPTEMFLMKSLGLDAGVGGGASTSAPPEKAGNRKKFNPATGKFE